MLFVLSFALYTLLIVAIGVYSARLGKRSDEDYFLAGRSLGPWVAALSASASSESGWVTLGLVGWAFTSGVAAYWIIPGCLLGFLFNWFVVADRLRAGAAETGALTLPDFLAFHFRERWPLLRVMSVIVILVSMLLYVAAQFSAAGKAFETSFDAVNYPLGVLIGAGIVLAYTVVGGFRAACWTDFVQGIIMVGTLVLFPAYLLLSNGGYAFIGAELSEISGGSLVRFRPEHTGPALLGFLLGSGALGINFGYPGQPHVLVRFMALRDARAIRIGGIVSAVWAVGVYWGAVTVGLVARALTESGAGWTEPLADQLANKAVDAGETSLVLSAIELAPGMVSGMVLAAVLAAICSTADSQLVVAASSVANDIYSRLIEKTGRASHLLINRTVVFLLGVVAVGLVINQEINLFQYVLTYGWAILGASFGPQLILVLLWKRATYAGCLAGMIVGFATALIWPQIYDPAKFHDIEIYNLPFAFILALAVNVVVSVLRPGDRASS